MTKQVRWTEAERTLVINKIADFMMSGAHTYIGRAAVEAQQLLPVGRRHQESSLQQNANTTLKGFVQKEIEARNINQYMAKQIALEKAKDSSQKAEPEVKEEKSAAPISEPRKIESVVSIAMDFLIDSLAEEFRKKLRASLNSVASDVMQELAERSALEASTFQAKEPVEVSAVNVIPLHSKEVKTGKLKAAIIGGDGKGSDRRFITEGLNDVYEFRFLDSNSSIGDNVKNCDLVIIRTKFCSHGQQYSAEKAVDKSKIIKFNRSSPNAINAFLLDHFAKLPTASAAVK